MDLTRRDFLALAGTAAITGPNVPAWRPTPVGEAVCVVQDAECCLLESITGYARAVARLDAVSITIAARELVSIERPRVIIVPASTHVPDRLGAMLLDRARTGTTVLIESGRAFLDANALPLGGGLPASFGVTVGRPIALWEGTAARHRVPYIDFLWPTHAMIRDFSRVVPLSGPAWRPVADVQQIQVGIARRVGRGRLVLLGSPLGPVLLAGDREAHTWLAHLLGRGVRPTPQSSTLRIGDQTAVRNCSTVVANAAGCSRNGKWPQSRST
jgi:hypothetical protein